MLLEYEKETRDWAATRLIVLDDPDEARDARDEIVAGRRSFAEIARARSLDAATAAAGGEAGVYFPGQLRPEIDAAAFATPAGAVSPVVAVPGAPGGGVWYCLVGVGERHYRSDRPFGEVREAILARFDPQRVYPPSLADGWLRRVWARHQVVDLWSRAVLPPPAG
ncbi:MAG: peptidylprolyl isomerase [Planctomycetes bacterium]|nr:peptidylprolyl isomerase [Planctomycetota bacterium]